MYIFFGTGQRITGRSFYLGSEEQIEMGETSPWNCTLLGEWDGEDEIVSGRCISGGVRGVEINT